MYLFVFAILALGFTILPGVARRLAPKINLGHQTGYVQGDIIDEKSENNIKKYFVGGSLKTNSIVKSGVTSSERLWQNGIVYYEVGSEWTESHLDLLQAAMTEIEDNTCIVFKKRTNEPNYIRVINNGGCSSFVGRRGGLQILDLYDSEFGTCWVHETIVHELLHAVGLYHEQMRPDRDDYLYLFLENVDPDRQGNFRPCMDGVECSDRGVPYNYLSVMQYDITAFGNDGKVTMLPKDTAYADTLGKAKTGHPHDYETVRRMYNCPKINLTCYECETSASNNCKTGSCMGEVCYTSIWKDRIVKGCGDAMYTFVGCRAGDQIGGDNAIVGCKSNQCNAELPDGKATTCKASMRVAETTFMLMSTVLLCLMRD